MPVKNTSQDFENWRIRHKPDRTPRKIKDSLFGFELRTPDEVAEILGLTRQRVDQIEKSAMKKIRAALQKEYDEM
jgi:DNA-directed RNA polymerase sigma subunit (sigma70/sigma32)